MGVTVDTRHIELKGEPKVKHLKCLTCNFAACQFRDIGLAVGKEHCFSGVIFRGLPLWISLASRGFQCLRRAEKLKLFPSSPVLWDHLAATSCSLFRG